MTEEETVIPAIEGMKTIIEAAVQNKVKRLVVTMSFGTLVGDARKSRMDGGSNIYDESDFAPEDSHTDPYGKSKIQQEKVIREFLEEQSLKGESEYKLEIVTLHPSFVTGPTLIHERNSSAEGVAKIMRRDLPGLPALCLPSVDVRDVAESHYLALFK